MSVDAPSLIGRGLTTQQRAQVAAAYDRLPPEERASVLSALYAEVETRSARDGLFWLTFVNTRDEADPQRTIKAFPLHLDYVRDTWTLLEAQQRIVIAKSRQMFVSWILSAFAVWTARYKPNSLVIYQTQKWEDAVAMVATPGSAKDGGYAGRMQFIEAHLPSWMRARFISSEGQIDYPNGSRVMALAGGANQIRGKTATLVIEDEFAFQPGAKGVYTAVAPLIQKGAKFIAVSTPNGAEGSLFYHLWSGIPYDVAV